MTTVVCRSCYYTCDVYGCRYYNIEHSVVYDVSGLTCDDILNIVWLIYFTHNNLVIDNEGIVVDIVVGTLIYVY